MQLLHQGKVRDVYSDGDHIILVASDRVSVFDVVLPTPIPDKGKILTALSLWWFEQLSDLVPTHVLGSSASAPGSSAGAGGIPPEFEGRAIRCTRLSMLMVECIARGYLTGLGLKEYERDGAVSGVPLPPGLVDGSRLEQPIFTPTTKAPIGEHDEFMGFDAVVSTIGAGLAEQIRDLTLAIYQRGAHIAHERGIIVADTKLEFGVDAAGVLTLGDEVLTPDSSRFWPLDSWAPGGPNFSFDKQFVRNWATASGWDKKPPAPQVPPEVVAVTRQRYLDVYERLTGTVFN